MEKHPKDDCKLLLPFYSLFSSFWLSYQSLFKKSISKQKTQTRLQKNIDLKFRYYTQSIHRLEDFGRFSRNEFSRVFIHKKIYLSFSINNFLTDVS